MHSNRDDVTWLVALDLTLVSAVCVLRDKSISPDYRLLLFQDLKQQMTFSCSICRMRGMNPFPVGSEFGAPSGSPVFWRTRALNHSQLLVHLFHPELRRIIIYCCRSPRLIYLFRLSLLSLFSPSFSFVLFLSAHWLGPSARCT